MARVRISAQVEAFLGRLPPEPRKKLRAALVALGKSAGDIKPLENELAGFHRLRVGRYRVVFCYAAPDTVDCVYAEERRIVYEVFAALLRERLER